VRQSLERARAIEAGRSLYHSKRWRDLRLVVLNAEPLCRLCVSRGRVSAATEVDHIAAHKGDAVRFWSRANLQPLCRDCHIAKTREERRQAAKGGRGESLARTAV
jgi:5-methylcytosine-specific restriction protein A